MEKEVVSDETYRTRIYRSYVESRPAPLAPATPKELEVRGRAILKPLIRKHFPTDREASILDIGCGHGALISCARDMGYLNVRGIDGSSDQIAAARRLGITDAKQGDLLEELQGRERCSVDVVVAFDVMEHFTRQELLPFVDGVHRVLRPKGRWIIHVPNGESPFFGRVRYGDLTHELAFTQMSLRQLLLSSGFNEVHCFEDTPVVHGAKSAIRWVLWKGFRAILQLYIAAETGDASGKQIFSQNLLAVATK